MKTLPPIRATPEQLPIISDNSLGIEVIRGAAGGGKTSTAILRLRSLAYWLEERRERQGIPGPLRILVLTYNRTLRGYVKALVDEQVRGLTNTRVTIDTFGRWAMGDGPASDRQQSSS
jgi:DNA helicase IV